MILLAVARLNRRAYTTRWVVTLPLKRVLGAGQVGSSTAGGRRRRFAPGIVRESSSAMRTGRIAFFAAVRDRSSHGDGTASGVHVMFTIPGRRPRPCPWPDPALGELHEDAKSPVAASQAVPRHLSRALAFKYKGGEDSSYIRDRLLVCHGSGRVVA